MTAQTLTPTDFLLARIAEDEAELREEFAAAFDIPTKTIRRRQAECEAKRRIVADVAELTWRESPDGNGWRDDESPEGGWVAAMDTVVRRLAAVYADHPDYREEWKP